MAKTDANGEVRFRVTDTQGYPIVNATITLLEFPSDGPPPLDAVWPARWVNIDNEQHLVKFGGYGNLAGCRFVRFQWYGTILSSGAAAAARNVQPGIRVLTYDAPDVIWTWQNDYGIINAHEQWFRHDAQGNRVKGSDVESWLPDLDNASYRAWCVKRVLDVVNTYQLDGFMWDGPNPDDTGPGPLAMLDELAAALGTRLIITNSTPSYDYGGNDDRYLARNAGTVLEIGSPATPNDGVFAWFQKMIHRNLAAGKYFVFSVDPKAPAALLYQYACYLLFADGKLALFDNQPLTALPGPTLGKPTGAAVESPARVWQRQFDGGKVVVDLNQTAASVG